MTLKDLYLAQLDREAALTRKTVERVPAGKNDFKPHQRSMDLGYLSALVAGMLGWIAFMVDRDELDLSEASALEFKPKVLNSSAELIASLDKAVAQAHKALEATTDEHLMTPWAFKMGGVTVQQEPRYRMIADAVFSHLAHHRGQLTVFLRLAESKVPALYGPSADERF
jgi:uncharacterized damage-inducible protein DinB